MNPVELHEWLGIICGPGNDILRKVYIIVKTYALD
jgi:hypothetical protein